MWHIPQNNYEKKDTFVILIYKSSMKRDKNLKITPQTHKILKEYCEKNGLKMFAFVERLIKEKCKPKTDMYGDELN